MAFGDSELAKRVVSYCKHYSSGRNEESMSLTASDCIDFAYRIKSDCNWIRYELCLDVECKLSASVITPDKNVWAVWSILILIVNDRIICALEHDLLPWHLLPKSWMRNYDRLCNFMQEALFCFFLSQVLPLFGNVLIGFHSKFND